MNYEAMDARTRAAQSDRIKKGSTQARSKENITDCLLDYERRVYNRSQ